eukprot:2039921-Alexandrium_andersonii.AAC.1
MQAPIRRPSQRPPDNLPSASAVRRLRPSSLEGARKGPSVPRVSAARTCAAGPRLRRAAAKQLVLSLVGRQTGAVGSARSASSACLGQGRAS